MTTALNSSTDELPPPTSPPLTPPANHEPPPARPTPPAPPTPPTPPTPEPRRRSGWHIASIVVGVLCLLPGLGMLAGGTTLAVANSVADDGYFDVTLDRVETDGVAIATVDLWHEAGQDEDWPWVLDWLDLDVRLRVDGARTTDDVFVGIARTADVEDYLEGTAYSELYDFDHRAPLYHQRGGTLAVAAPDDQDIWTVSAAGSGEQEITWEARGGRWSVVVMNADGSPGVAADVEVGVHSNAVMPIAITLLVVGGLVTIGAVTLIVVGARGRRRD